ncbi:MAG: ABC transporter substrate-binding protein [Oxalobacter sp.]
MRRLFLNRLVRLLLALSVIWGTMHEVKAVNPADPGKVLHTVFTAQETGFDPAVASDLYSSQVIRSIYEPLLTYDYLARPAKLVPETAKSLPEISEDGKTYTITVKKGIYFADDPAFGGKRRELIAADYIYSLKRLVDPAVRSAWGWLIQGKIAGLDALAAKAGKTGRFDYKEKIPGLELVSRYTFRIHLTHPDYSMLHILAHTPTAAVAWEVVNRYRDRNGQIMANPVGTGPYRLESWRRGSQMVMVANPNYRGFVWDFEAGDDPDDQRIVAEMQGKAMPQIGRVVIDVVPEDQSRWLAFQNREIDLFSLEGPLAPRALSDGQLKPELAEQGVRLSRYVEPELIQFYFNMRDPVIGGLSNEKIALRRAIIMAHNVQEEIDVVWNGQAVMLHFPIPPGVAGYDEAYQGIIGFEPDTANDLLDRYGYAKSSDGWRHQPDGSPLVIVFSARADSTGQQQLEMWKRTFDSLSIQMREDRRPFPDLLKAEKQCQLMMREMVWVADYPDGSNFMQLFYGPHIGQSNHGCVSIPQFDALYEEASGLPDGEARNLLYHKMARLLDVYTPTGMGYARYRNMLLQPYVIGYKKHPVMHNEWVYSDIDMTKK